MGACDRKGIKQSMLWLTMLLPEQVGLYFMGDAVKYCPMENKKEISSSSLPKLSLFSVPPGAFAQLKHLWGTEKSSRKGIKTRNLEEESPGKVQIRLRA